MTDTLTRLDALRALLAKHEPDGLTRALVWSVKQADKPRLSLDRPGIELGERGRTA